MKALKKKWVVGSLVLGLTAGCVTPGKNTAVGAGAGAILGAGAGALIDIPQSQQEQVEQKALRNRS